MEKKLFLIITVNKFPFGDAGAVRLMAFSKILLANGVTPFVISLGESTDFSEKVFDGVKHISLRYNKNNFIHRVSGRLLFVNNLKKVIKDFSVDDICGILFDSGTLGLFKYLKKIAFKHNIPLFFDDVEWYSACEFRFKALSPGYIHSNLINTKLIDDNLKVISISTYLEDYFKSKNITTIRVPVIMDVQNINFCNNTSSDNRVKIVYAGQVGGKDRLLEMVQAVSMLSDAQRKRILFNIVGITKDEFISAFNGEVLEKCADSVAFYGRVSRDEVLNILNSSNFSYLLRPDNERYAKAGFPTKIVEALSTGTPVICNLTSDLSLFIKHRVNGIVIKDCSAEACYESLEEVLSLPGSEIRNMSFEARKTALDNFDWKNYTQALGKFLLSSIN